MIIPTYNRLSQLKDCMQSILDQTVKPHGVIVVDDGNLAGIPLEKECMAAGIQCRYLKKEVPGLTESRNAGLKLACGEIVFFFDDDVILSKTYIAEILRVYETDAQKEIGGVGGGITNLKPMTLARWLRKGVEILFMISGVAEGRVLASGFFTDFLPVKSGGPHLKNVDFLPGCAMSFRKEIFEEFQFTDHYRAHGLGEDKDFSYQVSQKYRLVLNKKATLVHLESHEMRPDKRLYARKFVLGRYLFFRDHVQEKPWQWIFFAYSLVGYLMIRTIIFYLSWRRENSEHVLGILDGVGDILNQRVLAKP